MLWLYLSNGILIRVTMNHGNIACFFVTMILEDVQNCIDILERMCAGRLRLLIPKRHSSLSRVLGILRFIISKVHTKTTLSSDFAAIDYRGEGNDQLATCSYNWTVMTSICISG